jgi:hypothetical protein
VKTARQRIASLAESLGMGESGLAKRMRDSEENEEVMAVHAIIFFPPGTEERLDSQNGTHPYFPLGTDDREVLKTFFATSFAQDDASCLEYMYKGQLLYQPIRRLGVGSVLGSHGLARDEPLRDGSGESEAFE